MQFIRSLLLAHESNTLTHSLKHLKKKALAYKLKGVSSAFWNQYMKPIKVASSTMNDTLLPEHSMQAQNADTLKLAYILKKYALSQCICVSLEALDRLLLALLQEDLLCWRRRCNSSSSARQQHHPNGDGRHCNRCSHRVLPDNIQGLAPQPPPSAPAHNKTTCHVECNTAEVLAVSRFSVGWPGMRCIRQSIG